MVTERRRKGRKRIIDVRSRQVHRGYPQARSSVQEDGGEADVGRLDGEVCCSPDATCKVEVEDDPLAVQHESTVLARHD